MPTEYRTFRPDDLAAVARLHADTRTEPAVDRAAAQPADEDGEDLLRRVLAVEDGSVVGYAYVARSAWHPPAWFQTEVFVRPEARGRGVGSGLARRADAAAREVGAGSLTTWVGGDSPRFERFATKRGFREVQRFVTMSLSVADADEELLSRALADARSRGVTLFSFDETGSAPAARRSLYELNRRLAPLLPGNGDDFPTYEEYTREIVDAPWFRPEGQLVAAVGGRWVGLVGLGVHDGGREVRHEFTAVDPAFRRRGVALALKAWSVLRAREWGARVIRTGNDASNTAIVALNRRLGYDLRPGVVKLHR